MTYQDIGHLFFPLYLLAGLLACLCSVGPGWRRHLWVSFIFTSYVILLFQLRFDGEAHHLGVTWYGLVAFVQLVMLMVSYMLKVRAWRIILLTAAAAILIQAAYTAFWYLDMPLPKQGYFVGVNLMQVIQVGSLIFCAPMWPFLARRMVKQIPKRRESWSDSSQQRTSPRAVITGTR